METVKKHFKSTVLLGCALVFAVLVLNGCKKSEPQPTETSVESTKETAEHTAHEHAEAAAEQAEEAVSSAVEQTMCPVMDGNKIDKNVFVEYKGKKVYFCCPECKAKFLAEPEKYLAELPQFQK
jgi:YHS domain-containing protein